MIVLVDQGLNTLTNFALSYLLLRSVSTSAFGAFAIVYLVYIFWLLVVRSLAGEPQMIRFGFCTPEQWRRATSAATGVAVWLGMIGAVSASLAALFSNGPFRAELWPIGVSLPGLLMQDSWRYSFLSVGKGTAALLNDLVWAVAQVPLMAAVFLWLPRADRASCLILAWGAAGACAAVFGILQARLTPRLVPALTWLWTHRDLGPRFAAESLVDRGSSQLAVVSVGALSTLGELGVLNTGLLIWGPVNTLLMGLFAFVVPEGVRGRAGGPRRLARLVRSTGAGIGLISIACGAAVYFLPLRWAVHIFGQNWSGARGLIPWLTVGRVFLGIAFGARAGLRVLAAAKESLRVRSAAGFLALLSGGVGAAFDGALGFCIGSAFGSGLAAVLWEAQFEIINRRRVSSRWENGSSTSGNKALRHPGSVS